MKQLVDLYISGANRDRLDPIFDACVAVYDKDLDEDGQVDLKGKAKWKQLTSREQAMKILVNAMSYGIFIELNPEDKKSEVEVYGLDQFSTKKNHHERPGAFFHPFLGMMITSGARLFLAMAETKLLSLEANHIYMDTDSIFVPAENAEAIIDHFKPLNPYKVSIPLLKAEEEDVWFYGISSKRYVLYRNEREPFDLIDFKHGLGHLTNPFPNNKENWQAEIWRDLLKLHYDLVSPLALEQKYSLFYAIAKMTTSTAHLWSRFDSLNKGKDWNQQIKPFNFFLVAFQMVRNKKKPSNPCLHIRKIHKQSSMNRSLIMRPRRPSKAFSTSSP